MNTNDPLLQPFTLKHLTLRNRLMTTAHEPAYSEDGMPKKRYRLYHQERAKGGIALTMTAGSAVVSADSPAAFGNLFAYKDEIVPWLSELTDACHAHGTAVMIQLTHLGRRSGWNTGDWLPLVAASRVRESAHRSFPKAAEDWDLERIANDYAAAAQRMVAAGLDGFEIQCNGHLPDGFWSPATNHRNDQYGGSLENRTRFTRQILEKIRHTIGPEFIVGVRMTFDEYWPQGFDQAEGRRIAQVLLDSGQVDFINVIRGRIESEAALLDQFPGHGMRRAPDLNFAGEVRQQFSVPTFHATGINDIATARHAIAEGKLDMVGMVRAHIADPHIVQKIIGQREHEIRPCVGATYCLDRIYENGEALCIHNAATGREASMPQTIAVSGGHKKHIVVVGAGPAGLEAAKVAAERGHQVTLLEAAAQTGGQLQLIARSQRRAELLGITTWRTAMCESLGVDMRFNLYAEVDDVLAFEPDIVVIATGGVPDTEILPSGNQWAVSSWDIIAGDVTPKATVLVYDDNGGHPGMQAAEMLAEAGSALEIVTPERFFAPEIGGINHVAYARAFQKHQAVITLSRRVVRVEPEGDQLRVSLASDYGDFPDSRLVDQLVVEHGTLPNDALYFGLKAGSVNGGEVDYQALIQGEAQTVVRNPQGKYQLFRIGDAVASRNIHAAVYDALRLVKNF